MRWIIGSLVLLLIAFLPISWQPPAEVRIGSKKFTESVVLGELMAQLSRKADVSVQHVQELGGTRLVFEALKNGDIDAYPEYSGTITAEIFAEAPVPASGVAQRLSEDGISMSRPLGFNNTYALAMKRETAERLAIKNVSDLVNHPELNFGFSNEFMERGDGWPSLRQRYGLPQESVKGLDHDLAYRQLDTGVIDVMDAYTTDAKIRLYDLKLLVDDRKHFPRYDAVLLYRDELERRYPKVVEKLLRLEGQINQNDMAALNAQAEQKDETEALAASGFLSKRFGVESKLKVETAAGRILKHTLEHLDLVRKSLVPAILLAIPLGILAVRKPVLGQGILATVGVIQTIPALALLVMLMTPVNLLNLPSVGAGSATAILALFLYSLLPIVRNTYTGLHGISPAHRESAIALGLPASARLQWIELPLASRSILAGIKTAAVINIGFATLGALIGAGGYGQPILTGIRRSDTSLILQGAVPAAVMALLAQGLFELAERFVVPKGLRLKSSA